MKGVFYHVSTVTWGVCQPRHCLHRHTGRILSYVRVTCKGSAHLPKDQGREFAVGGALSVGKPRGAGLIFVLVFAITAVLFAHVDPEMIIYLLLLICCMMTGYLDDAAKTSWGRLKKGILDFLVALLVTFTYLHFNGNQITLALTGSSFSIQLLFCSSFYRADLDFY